MSKLRSTFSLGIARLASMAINVVSIPLYLNWVGDVQFGAVVLIQIVSTYCILLGDGGLSFAVQHEAVHAAETGDPERMATLVDSHRIAMAAGGGLAFLAHVYLLLFVPIEGMATFGHKAAFVLFSGFAVFLFFIAQSYVTFLTTQDRFDSIASANLIASFFNTGVSLWLVYQFRHVWGYAVGSVISQAVLLAVLHRRAMALGTFRALPRWDWSTYQTCLPFAKYTFVNNIGTSISWVDSMVLKGMFGQSQLATYSNSSRIPLTISQVLPVSQVFQPEFARAHARGSDDFHRTYLKNSLATLTIGLGFLFVPTAFGREILKTWLGHNYSPEMFSMLVAAGIAYALSTAYSTFAIAAFGAGKPKVVVPFIFFFGIGVATLSMPVAINFGLVGTMWLRAFLQISQFFVLDWVMKRAILPELNLGALFAKKLLITAVAGAVWGLGFAASSALHGRISEWTGVLTAPLLVFIFLVVVGRTGLVEMPEKLRRFMPWAFPARK